MFFQPKHSTRRFFKRSAVFGLTAVGLFCTCLPSHAQRAGGEKPSRFMDRIDAEEGMRRLADFRQQRLDGDFCFEFELEHKPRRARTVRYEGIMWGSWNELGPVTRFRLSQQGEDRVQRGHAPEAVELIIQNGVVAQAWIRRPGDADFHRLEGEALFEPLLPGLLYSPFDLQMPFIYWENFVYEGPTLIGASRVAQQFLMLPPRGSASAERGIAGVRVGLDDIYNALWRIEIMDTEGDVVTRFAVESFKKVQKQYIVKRITLTDYPSKGRTTFDVEKAAVGISVSSNFFDPFSALPVDLFVPKGMEEL